MIFSIKNCIYFFSNINIYSFLINPKIPDIDGNGFVNYFGFFLFDIKDLLGNEKINF